MQRNDCYGILTDDFNQDGFVDIMLAGNSYATEVMVGQYDASVGLLLGNFKGGFSTISAAQNGLFADGDIKGTSTIEVGDNMVYPFARNMEKLSAYEHQEPEQNIISVADHIIRAKIIYRDGISGIHEFHYGSSYLFQSSRKMQINKDMETVIFYDQAGNEEKRTYDID